MAITRICVIPEIILWPTLPIIPQLATLETDMTNQGATVTCYSSTEEYCVSATLLVGEGDFCVDSTGMANTYSAGAGCDGTNFDCAIN